MEGITVHGRGRVTLTPDTATVSLGANVRAQTAADAQRGASERMNRILAALERLGIADADVTTQRVSLMPIFEYKDGTERPSGFQADQSVLVKIRDVSRLGPVIDAAVEAGANAAGDIVFGLADEDAAADRAREAAIADARRHAETLARAAGVSLGAPVSIREAASTPPPPIPFERGLEAADASTPIRPGSLEVTVEVDVTFAIG